jgi:hypothetical protein
VETVDGSARATVAVTPSTCIDGEAFLLEAYCDACRREPGALMCALCEALTVAEMFPVGAEPDRDDTHTVGHDGSMRA